MKSDFIDYGSNSASDISQKIQTISEGASTEITAQVTISTWQSIYKQDAKWFNQFKAIIVDEVHLAQANSIRSIMEKSTEVAYKIGLTGTLSGAKTHELVIEGLFGKIRELTTTKDLMDKGHISNIDIKCLILEYQDKAEIKLIKGADYIGELAYICEHEKRNNFIKKLALDSTGNTLVLFTFVEKHGKIIYELIKKEIEETDKHRKVFFIHGKVDGDDRNAMRAIVEKEENAIIVASYGTLSVGTNIKRLHNIIAASPTKSVIRLLQSIGRGLRKGEGKDILQWIDICDDFSGGTKKLNYAMKHFIERLRIYNEKEFKYKILKLKI